MTADLTEARRLFTEGIPLYESGRFAEAEALFAQAARLAPDRPSVLTNLGAARVKLGRHAEAIAPLRTAAHAEPDNLEAWAHLTVALATEGHRDEALAAVDRALLLDPHAASLWTHRGSLLREGGDLDGARSSFERARAEGGDSAMNRYFLASVQGEAAPATPPREYVEALFDSYAADFDQHLVATLGYDAPRVLLERLPPRASGSARQVGTALDLGCGTGLCGPWLRKAAARVDGIDLSARMLAEARKTGAYDQLLQADALAHLQSLPDARLGLVAACDVFIYVGALDTLFAEVARVLVPGGLFAFTVEPCEGADWQLLPSLRYAHSAAYVQRLASTHGLRVVTQQTGILRHDQRTPVPGLFFHLERP